MNVDRPDPQAPDGQSPDGQSPDGQSPDGQSPDGEEERLASMLDSVNNHVAPPDPDFLARLRTQSTEAFIQAEDDDPMQVSAPVKPQRTEAVDTRRPKPTSPKPTSSKPTSPTPAGSFSKFIIRGVAIVIAAAAIVVGLWLGPFAGGEGGKLAFGDVLAKVDEVDSLHLEVTRDGRTDEVWIHRPGRMRWEESSQRYRIIRGSKLWRIDEKAKRVTAELSSFSGDAGSPIDILDLLAVGIGRQRDHLLKHFPVDRVQRDGLDCHVYRMQVETESGPIHIEALVDARTNRLHRLEAKLEQNGLLRPVGELRVIAFNPPIDDDKFLVSKNLTAEVRVGTIVDSQGIVTLKPVMQRRWTPVTGRMQLTPGDWLRTDNRGANAVRARLKEQGAVTLGPGTLVEMISPHQIRLLQGEMHIEAAEKKSIEVVGPGRQVLAVKETLFVRATAKKLDVIKTLPRWLAGFNGTITQESLGSLIAKVDGRDVPLTVGVHEVRVNIRDQIARTTIEETFVNHTNAVLEGVFYFPLPDDASISGFGMWVGNDLIEADIVEKQRAREIYEIILREKRDPGLLEWSEGNIFKARVYPIPANGEKRIKITYTQVLPLKGSRYRYSYHLQSEMLKETPLRQLSLDVKIFSALPLKSVECPTHLTRNDKTAHAAHVEFTAQDYTPTRDFEVVIETDVKQSDVVVIPHRRGDDGYFLMQLMPPAGEGLWKRKTLPDGEPLEILLLADTSSSMNDGLRASQAEFVATILMSLAPEDRFNLAGCDVDCRWAFEKSMPANEKNIATARMFLAERISLGWTDLDKAFASVLKRSGANTHVVYIGDGIVTAGDADPVAFINRLDRLYEQGQGRFHAVTVGNSYEATVLKSIASLGGGSMRKISEEQGPQAAALELLHELTRPGLRDLKIEFEGVQVARVYPEQLPNIPAGAQQIILGRYLPEGKDQRGKVVVTGKLGNETVRYESLISFKEAETGNSFIPRLWARMHLDSLLLEGRSQDIQDEIIALSEEFHIMTPYTSLLVLESDADRQRFKVKRRYQIRDGERFFAKGQDEANYQLVQKQMKRAGLWRMGLRRKILAQLSGLGRDASLFQPSRRYPRYVDRLHSSLDYGRLRPGLGGEFSNEWYLSQQSSRMIVLSDSNIDRKSFRDAVEDSRRTEYFSTSFDGNQLYGGTGANFESRMELIYDDDSDSRFAKQPPSFGGEWSAKSDEMSMFDLSKRSFNSPQRYPGSMPMPGLMVDGDGLESDLFSMSRRRKSRILGRGEYAGKPFLGGGGYYRTNREQYFSRPNQYTQWVNTLFPQLPASPKKQPVEPKSKWPAEAVALSKSLLRTESLRAMTGGVELKRVALRYDTRWDRLTANNERRELYSPKVWLTRPIGQGGHTVVNWCDEKQRGVVSKAFQLGRIRKSVPLDLSTPPLDLADYSIRSVHRAYATYETKVEVQGENRTQLVLNHPSNPGYVVRLHIDTARHVLLRLETIQDGKAKTTMMFTDFVEAGGSWWARKIETTDAGGKRVGLITQTINAHTLDALKGDIKKELAGRDSVQFIQLPALTVAKAKQAVADGKAGFGARLVMMLHFSTTQQWDRVNEHLEAVERLAENKPGLRWVRNAVLLMARRNEELRLRFLDEAARQVAHRHSDDMFLIDHLFSGPMRTLENNELLEILKIAKPVYERQPAYRGGVKKYNEHRVSWLRATGQVEAALALLKQMATDHPHDPYLQTRYAQELANSGAYPAAYAWLDRVLASETKWNENEKQNVHYTYYNLLRRQGRYADLVKHLAKWVAKNPKNQTAYAQYLSALIFDDQVDVARKLMLKWMKEARIDGKLKGPALGRLNAAVSLARGQGHDLYSNRIQEEWLKPLAETVRFFIRHKHNIEVASSIMGHYRFQQSDECWAIRGEIAEILKAEIETLSPRRIEHLTSWLRSNDPPVSKKTWQTIAAGLQKRWESQKKDEVRHRLGTALLSIYSAHFGIDERLAFLRLQMNQGPKRYRGAYARQLFDLLIQQPWTAKYEDEAFTLLEKLSNSNDPKQTPTQRLGGHVAALYRLTNRMIQARYQVLMAKTEHQETLKRLELRKLQTENRKAARTGYADRLQAEIAKGNGPLVPWLKAEHVYLDVVLDRNRDEVIARCWEVLGDAPKKRIDIDDLDDEQILKLMFEEAIGQRYFVTLANLATRHSAEKSLATRLLKYIDAGIAVDPAEFGWKSAKYNLLIALDRPQELERALQVWINKDEFTAPWRLSLARLLAEQGKIKEAIAKFESVKKDNELGPVEYGTLANWYMAVDRRNDYQRARMAVYETMQEHQLGRWLSSQYRVTYQNKSSELDTNVLLVFRVVFHKSSHPQNYLNYLRQIYQATRDFRLLESLPEAVVGQTARKVYPFLQGMGSVLNELRDEAAADSILKRLEAVRKTAKTDVDLRALDLLEMLVERRSAEVLNQPGPHVEKAVAALIRASERDYRKGEPRLMAEFLAGLGRISQRRLATEQLRQLRALHAREKPGSIDRLHIAHQLANTLWNAARGRNEAVDLLQTALREFERTHPEGLPAHANGPLSTYVSFLESKRHYARAELVLLNQLRWPANLQQTYWLNERLDRVFQNALEHGGQVQLGSGQILYKNLIAKLEKDADTSDDNHRYNIISRLMGVFRTAKRKSMSGVPADLRRFAFERLPKILKRQNNNYNSIVNQTARALDTINGSRDALEFLIVQIETEPARLRYSNQDCWQQNASYIGELRHRTRTLGALDGRLLNIVSEELRRELRSRQQNQEYLYHQNYSYFWKEKANAFAAVAEEVYAERKKSAKTVVYIAGYLFGGLSRHDRAIEILFVAHNDGLLDESGQSTLVDYLAYQNRYGELIGVVRPLVELYPDNMTYRRRLMHALFRTKRQEELLTALKATDAYFHKDRRWTEHNMAQLAESCLENELYEQSAAYYKELIPRHERTAPRRGIGNGTLSRYYTDQARAYSGLHRTKEAVDAAAGAIISWGPRHHRRKEATETLKNVLRDASDRDAYAAFLDREAEKSEQDRPIVRKALGLAYKERRQFKRAVRQLKLAVELQPNDIETHQALVDCYDGLKDNRAAIRQQIQMVHLNPRKIELYKKLAERYEKQSHLRERANTSIVEALPKESESHALLAGIRQGQDRWDEAIGHWQHVARIRKLEPTGLLKLAAAQIHQKQWGAARSTVDKLRSTNWPERFNKVKTEVRALEQQLNKPRLPR